MVTFLDLSLLQLLIIGLAAFIVGFTKTSVGGIGILSILLMAIAFPGKASPGVLLPLLIVGDIFAVIFYHRECQWHILLKIFPLTAFGVIIGYLVVDSIPASIFEKIIGIMILIMLMLEIGLSLTQKDLKGGWFSTGIMGIFAGIATMIANAAGPIFGLYLLQMGLTKNAFIGTRSWFFLILNLFKVPFSANLGLITVETLKLDLLFLPVILIGAFIGYHVLKFINIQWFTYLIRIAVVISAFRLIF